MRTKNELIDIIIENYKNYSYSGLCSLMFSLVVIDVITNEEKKYIKQLIYSYTPKYTYNINGARVLGSEWNLYNYKWKPYAKAPRIKWLKSQKDTE